MTDESPASLDTHLDSILKGNQETWRDYTFSRLKLYDFIHHGDRLDWEFSESDASIRFHIGNGKLGLNRLFLLYEIGDIAPSFRWRKLIRTSSGFYPSSLPRPTYHSRVLGCKPVLPVSRELEEDATQYLNNRGFEVN